MIIVLKSGPYEGQIVMVDGPEYGTLGGWVPISAFLNPEARWNLTFYCDNLRPGYDSMDLQLPSRMECYEVGILDSRLPAD
jgi:aldehyde:ferredoxin oxidoreductase